MGRCRGDIGEKRGGARLASPRLLGGRLCTEDLVEQLRRGGGPEARARQPRLVRARVRLRLRLRLKLRLRLRVRVRVRVRARVRLRVRLRVRVLASLTERLFRRLRKLVQ